MKPMSGRESHSSGGFGCHSPQPHLRHLARVLAPSFELLSSSHALIKIIRIKIMDDHPPSGDYGDRVGVTDPRDTLIQIVLSLTLGIGGFVAFCVCIPCFGGVRRHSTHAATDSTTTMDHAVLRAKEANWRNLAAAGASKYSARMGAGVVERH